MMNFKSYPIYKDSGVKWLGEVPEHWNVVKLKNVLKKNITDGPHETPMFIEEGIPFLSVDSIQNGELVFENCRYISEEAHKLYSKKAKVEKNDLLMGKAASIGKIALVKVDFEFSIWSPLALIKIKPTKASSKYMEYLLKSTESQVQIDNLSTYSTQKNISMADIPKIRFSIPCLKEQSAITSFLDSETSRIDNLIAKQEKLIEKLEEHRKSVISHAVTKGLDPNVPMKDSGVKWLGEVPEHWNVVKLKNVLKKNITDGPHETPIFIEEGIPFLSVDSIQNGELVFENCRYISEEAHKLYSKKAKVEKNDLLMGKAASIGKIALVKVDFEFSIWSPLALIKIKPTKASSKYMEYLLKSTESQVQIDNLSTYSTQKNISMADIPKIRFSIPCLKEQSAITTFLDSETSRIDNLIAKQEKLIEKLKEYRTSIISHAVTGKIDVRDLVA